MDGRLDNVYAKVMKGGSSAPFAKEAIEKHIKSLDLLAEPIDDKISYLRSRFTGKRVLDVGMVEHDYSVTKSDAWLHRHISEVAESCLGVDILEDQISMLKRDGYSVVVHDLCESPIVGDFDYVFMGELIEHVGASESLLRNAYQALAKDGRLIITTPNPWYINTLLGAMRRGFFVDNADHVAWYDPGTMQALALRCDLELVCFAGLRGMTPRTVLGKVAGRILSRLSDAGALPLADCKSIMYELRRTE